MVTAVNVPDTVYKIPREVILAYNSKKRVGNYLIGKSIGEGAFAKVKEGLHVITGEKVAIKIIDKTKAKQDSYLWKNLKREVKLLQCMRHPNVVNLYESLETEIAYYLVLELIRGGEMKDYISKSDRLSEKETKKFMSQLLSAVWHIHSAGVVHRDLKVENIMLSKSGDIKIIDFGLSNCLKSLESKGGRGTQCGSPAYAAPELLANKGYDKRVDIWAVGINMFAMLVGKLPFKVKPFNLKKLYQKMITGDMELLPPGTSQGARDLLLRLLQPDPKDRISIKECATHQWLADENVQFISSPNFPVNEDLNQEVISYMEEFHNANVHSLVLDLLTHNINSTTATYHHMTRKFDRYLLEQEKSSRASLEISDDPLQNAIPSKKEINSSRRNSKTKVLKRRPKTAGTVVKRSDSQPEHYSTHSSASKPRRNSVGNILKKTTEKKQAISSPTTKEAFRGRVGKEAGSPSTTDETTSKSIPEDSGFSGSRKMSVVSYKSTEPSKSSISSKAGGTSPGVTQQRPYKYRSGDHVNTVYGSARPDHNISSPSRDGKANWRQTPLIKTKFSVSSPARSSPVSLARVSNHTVHFQTHKRSDTPSMMSENSLAAANTRTTNGYSVTYGTSAGIQWPPIREGSARSDRGYRTRSPVHPASLLGHHDTINRQSMSYKWRSELQRAKIAINKNTTHVLKRNISFPADSAFRPQTGTPYRTYSYR
ncbi:hypothetical protein ACHWQZ_G005421 [Mnemiopsis leidyi]